MNRRKILQILAVLALPAAARAAIPDTTGLAAPQTYPIAEAVPGLPFADPNFKLAVLDALLDAKAIGLGSPKQLAEHVLRRPAILEHEGHHLIRPAYDYLVRYPLTAELLASVTALTFDGGDSIYEYIYYYWNGVGDMFDVKSLEGIELMPNLRRFDAISMLDDHDLRRLAKLSKLEVVSLSLDTYTHVEALLALPALRELTYFDGTIAGTAWLELLEFKGVKLKVNH